MKISNSIEILGDPQKIGERLYQLAADIQDWGWLPPHRHFAEKPIRPR